MPAPSPTVSAGFRLPRILLPRPDIDLKRWAVIACDQHTAEPQYWRDVEREVGDAPSSLHLIFPEVFLDAADAPARIRRIQQTMRSYLAAGLLRGHDGAVYVERRVGAHTRRGLMLELDLEHYDFRAGSTSLIRPTEGTMVARLAPRIEVRRGAEIELPHVLVLIDDPSGSVIEPIGAARDSLRCLYRTELMLGGGQVAGYAVDAAQGLRAARALGALADARAFAARYGVPAGTPPMLFAVGDGNHSLATAKSIWDGVKGTVGIDHPSRFALVEVQNIHDPALAFAPIHRLLFGVNTDAREALAECFGPGLTCTEAPSAAAMRERVDAGDGAGHRAGLIGPGARYRVIERARAALGVGEMQAFVDHLVRTGAATQVDYVHGDEALERLAAADGHLGVHLPRPDKRGLLRAVVHHGALPRKAFSMGEPHEKRYYVEARRIREPADAPSPG